MKKPFLLVAILVAVLNQSSTAQDSTDQRILSQLLSSYFSIKDALVAGNADTVSSKAVDFIKTANSIDFKVISEGNINALLKDATTISETKDLNKQRVHFARLSSNMATLAKAQKLSGEIIYQAYCPMKKVFWLSAEKDIRNPYYGSAMLTCGEVVETIKH